MIYRRFGFLHARILLAKQDEIANLEEELDEMDKNDMRNDQRALQNRAYDESRQHARQTRKKHLARIEAALLSYDKLLLNSQQLVGSNRPTKREHRNVIYFFGHKRPIAEGEEDYIKHREDLITLRPGREMPWLDAFMLKVIPYLHRFTMKMIFYDKVGLCFQAEPSSHIQLIFMKILGNGGQNQGSDFLLSKKHPHPAGRQRDCPQLGLPPLHSTNLLTFLRWRPIRGVKRQKNQGDLYGYFVCFYDDVCPWAHLFHAG